MANLIKSRDQVNRMNVDQGDGTYAEVVAVAGIPDATTPGLLPVDTLATPTRMVPHALTSVSTSVVLLAGTRRVSVDVSVNAVLRINGTASVPANGTALADAIAVPAGVTKDFDVPASTTLHFVRDAATDGTIRITDLL